MIDTFADGKPKDCRCCYYYEKKNGCLLPNCYYAQSEKKKSRSECDGCPYRTYGPCIGWCTQEILRSDRRCAK